MDSAVIAPTQTKRHIRLATTLGDDVLIPISVRGTEAMSALFRYDLQVYSTKRHDLQPKDVIAKPVTIGLVREDQTLRYFNGIVSEFEALGRRKVGSESVYRMTVVPALWLLSHTYDYRIFQDVDVKDLINIVLADYADHISYKIEFSEPHPKRRFITQYAESDLNVLLRWLRKENVAFYFTHEDGKHTLHFIDNPRNVKPHAPETLILQPPTAGHSSIVGLTQHAEFVPGRAAQNTYNYRDPDAPVFATVDATGEAAEITLATKIGRYRYTDTYLSASDAGTDTQRWLIRGMERRQVVRGTATYHLLEVGKTFTVVHAQVGEWLGKGKSFTLTEISFHASDQEGGEAPFTIDFAAVPKGELVYPAKIGWPVVHGLQTAVVVGPEGEEIHTDELGRVKVRFHWDRRGVEQEGQQHETSCWLRVMQPAFAGPGFGMQMIPRIGQEVVVAFENGNPDRPFIIGALHHENHKPPYGGPGKTTQYGIRGRSTKQGGTGNYNELRFDDKKGAEEIFIQAERDLNANIKRNETRAIGEVLHIKAGSKILLEVGGSVIEITGGRIRIDSAVVDIDGNPVEIN